MFCRKFVLIIFGLVNIALALDANTVRKVFISNLLNTIGQNGTVSLEDIRDYLDKRNVFSENSTVEKCTVETNVDPNCILETCLSAEDVYQLSGVNEHAGENELSTLSTILLHLRDDVECVDTEKLAKSKPPHKPPSTGEVWGFGLLCTALISVCSLSGVLVVPCMKGETYKKVLIYMVGLAVGTLAGSSLLFLIPEALELTEQELNAHSYVWKCLTVIVAIFAFFNVERILRIITEEKEKGKLYDIRNRPKHAAMDLSSFHLAESVTALKNADNIPSLTESDTEGRNHEAENGSALLRVNDSLDTERHENGSLLDNSHQHGHTHGHSHGQAVEPVAWMIIFGDGLHNLIDGISIGAAFTDSILAGVSVSVAILCEEMPHELGDFAVLLNAGMTIKRAVFYNFISACVCFVGLIIGIFLGENASTHTWVFAIAAGMFLYISLVDMMPEMGNATEVEENKRISHAVIYLLENFGMITGFGLMLLLAIYGGELEHAIRGD